MNDQFLVCKQARGLVSSKTQGKVIEDEYARAGQTRCGQSLQEEWSFTMGVDYCLSELLHVIGFKYHNDVLTRYISACQSNENGKVEAAVKTVKRLTPNRKEE